MVMEEQEENVGEEGEEANKELEDELLMFMKKMGFSKPSGRQDFLLKVST